MLRGMSTITFFADDLAAATRWYADVLGIEPYFTEKPGYVEFRLGDYQHELGLLDGRYAPPGSRPSDPAGGAVTYWAVDDVRDAFDRLLKAGATEHLGVTKQGEGFVTASVVDPFGNVLGVMENVHYLSILAERS